MNGRIRQETDIVSGNSILSTAKRLLSAAKKLRLLSSGEKIVMASIPSMLLPDTYTGIVIAVLSLFILIDRSKRTVLSRSPATVTLIPLFLVLLVPSVLSMQRESMIKGLAVWLLFVFGLYASEIMTKKLIPLTMDALLLCSASAAVYGIICRFIGRLELGRVYSIFENPNHYAYAIELFVLIALCRYTCTRKTVYLVAAVANILMNLLCGCRTAWLAILAGVTVYSMLTIRQRWLPVISAAAGGVFAGCLRMIPEIGDRLTVDSVSHSFDNRMRYWENSLRWFRQRPIIGWGISSYSFLSANEGEKILAHAHNMILNILLDTGVIGLFVLSAVMVLWLRDVFTRTPDPELLPYRNLAAAAVTATLIHGLTDFTLLGVSTSIIFMLIISVSGCMRRGMTEHAL